jgi:hypothetical protein
MPGRILEGRNCPAGGRPMLVEAIDQQRKRVYCPGCGEESVQDMEGRKLLTGGARLPASRLILG